MSNNSTTTITVLLSIILATSAFIAVATSHTPSKIFTAEQAINLIKGSSKTDPRIIYGTPRFIGDSPFNGSIPVSTNLEYVSLNWADCLKTLAQNTLFGHSRIYVSQTPVGEVRPYWFIDYETQWASGMMQGSGRYIIDAQTGELMLSLENVSGGVNAISYDYKFSIEPNVYLWDQNSFSNPGNYTDHALAVKVGEYTPVMLTLSAQPYYNASLPVSMNVTTVPEGFSVSQSATSEVLKTGGSVSFMLDVYTPITIAVGSVSQPQLASQVPRIDVEISLAGTTKSYSIFVAPTVNATVTNHTIDLGNVSLPQRFIVERDQSQSGTRIHNYKILLNAGDAIGYEFNSTQQVGFSIYYIADKQPSSTWHSENGTHLRSGLIALKSGTYDFAFTINSLDANVTFSVWRVKWDPSNVVFKESGSSSSAFGGMGLESIYLEPPPRSFVVGRTWYNSSWMDHSLSFEATLSKGTVIDFGYNATETIIFNFTSDSGTVISRDDLYSYNNTYTVPSTGIYNFSFDVVQPKTAIVAFRCRATSASSLSYPDQTAVWIEDPQLDEAKPAYSFPPAMNRTTTITGKLGTSTFPTSKGEVMIIKLENSTKSLLLHLGTPSEFIPVPAEGYTMLGNVTLTDLNNAYLGNSTIRVTGFPFQISLNGVVIDLFHVNSAEIIGPYPLYAQESSDVVSGYYNQGLDSDKVEYFPIRFNLGFDNYTGNGETYYGNVERFYSSYVKQGTTLKISYNATKPVEFGFYTFRENPDVSVVTSFDLGKPGDYIFRESGVQSFEQLFNVPRSGFYTFAFKASGGVKSSVVLDVSMIK